MASTGLEKDQWDVLYGLLNQGVPNVSNIVRAFISSTFTDTKEGASHVLVDDALCARARVCVCARVYVCVCVILPR